MTNSLKPHTLFKVVYDGEEYEVIDTFGGDCHLCFKNTFQEALTFIASIRSKSIPKNQSFAIEFIGAFA
jgi:hypothetical protein